MSFIKNISNTIIHTSLRTAIKQLSAIFMLKVEMENVTKELFRVIQEI